MQVKRPSTKIYLKIFILFIAVQSFIMNLLLIWLVDVDECFTILVALMTLM